MIGLTLRGKKNDRFWFSFFHEASHILNDSKKSTFVDSDGEKSSVEDQANALAADLLIPRRHAAEGRSERPARAWVPTSCSGLWRPPFGLQG